MAAGITDAVLPKGNCAVRIMLFVGGPTTEGGGQVVDKELEQPIRSHKVGPGALNPETCALVRAAHHAVFVGWVEQPIRSHKVGPGAHLWPERGTT